MANQFTLQELQTIYPSAFTTASQQTWLSQPQSTSPLASPSNQTQQQDFQAPQDFVLFPRRSLEASPSAQNIPSSSHKQALSGQYRRHSSNQSSASTLQNQRVAAIIQGTGHSISSPAFTNRYNPIAQTQSQFYASSAPSSSVALQQQQQHSRPRPQVPLFSQSTGNIPSKQTFQVAMNQDMDLFDDFPAYDMDATVDTSNFPEMYNYSPAVPTMYETGMSRSVSSSTTNMGTVSPSDLMVRDPSMSAPNSTAFTNLTSPSMYNESPDYPDGYEVSPMYAATDLDNALSDPWFPLFPDAAPQSNIAHPDQSPLEPDEELEVSEQLRSNRRRSGTSPGSNKASSTSGVNRRKRDQPLPPIVVEDPNDTTAIKRARNTLAARKSRQKKMERFDELEERIRKAEEDRDYWKALALAAGVAQQ